MRVFVVIVTYNGLNWLERCIGKLSTSTIPLEVLVIDNHSTDGTASFILGNYPHVDCTPLEKNLGFGQANNLGIAKALTQGADYVFLLNQDAWIQPNSIERLISVQEENKTFGILSPIHVNSDGSKLEYGFSQYLSVERCSGFISDVYMDKNRLKEVYEILFVNAAAWLLSRECLEKVGGFDPIFFHYGEDNNFVNRVKFHGLKIGICPHSIIHHARDMQKKLATDHSMSNPYSTFRMILTQYTNINASFVSAYLKESVYSFVKMLLFALLLKGGKAKYYRILLKQHILYYARIKESRRLNKIEGMNYLSFKSEKERNKLKSLQKS